MKPKYYFHADDYGRSKLISDKILYCIKYGNVNSVSVMIGFDENSHAKLKKIKKKINYKLHINLTEMNKFNNFRNYSFMKLLFLPFFFNFQKQRRIIRSEIKSQIQEFLKFYKLTIVKLDSHEHVHMIPWIFDLIIKDLNIFNVREIRIPDEKFFISKKIHIFNKSYLTNLLKLFLIKTFSYIAKKKVKNKKFKILKFTGLVYSGIQDFLSIKSGAKINYDKNSSIEILIHPGFTNKTEINFFNKKYFDYYSSINRRKEFNLSLSNKIKVFLNKEIYSNS
jgi:predicted glycoside hydrolase/deacetylase ChbG (UPF0249 family)